MVRAAPVILAPLGMFLLMTLVLTHPPPRIDRTVQSETEIAVLNKVRGADGDAEHSRNDDGDDESEGSDDSGKLMVAGYNDSYGFDNNKQGLSGFSYSTNGGKSWIDGGGLPPIVKAGLPAGTPGQDSYFGDPVVQVHHCSKTFYYASLYLLPDGTFSLAVNRGQFKVAPPQGIESKVNTRCEGNPSKFGVPDPPATIRRRVLWEPPVVAVPVFNPGDFLDKEWLYVDQRTGELYLAYVRFGVDGSTPLEMVRSFDGGHTWTPPSIIVPNLLDTFNTGLSVATTPTGRVVVSWWAETFDVINPPFPIVSERIESAFSDDGGVTFNPTVTVTDVNPQGEPKGYNRGRSEILNVTYLAVDERKTTARVRVAATKIAKTGMPGNGLVTAMSISLTSTVRRHWDKSQRPRTSSSASRQAARPGVDSYGSAQLESLLDHGDACRRLGDGRLPVCEQGQ